MPRTRAHTSTILYRTRILVSPTNIRMDTKIDFTTWSNVARCFRMWDLDARGFHKSTWRFWIKKNHILAVGCPASEYCKNKPQELEPIYLPNRETRPKDYLSSRRKITIQEATLFLNINFIDIKQQYFTLQIVTY